MTIYRHRQTGTLVLWALAAGVALCVAVTVPILEAEPWFAAVPLVAALIFVVCMVLFASLTVEVTPDRVAFAFGPGAFRQNIPAANILAARSVRNRWYYGWGIRILPGGWLYNVSGLDAVEIDLTSGRKVRIGTDEPERLLAAVLQVAGRTGGAETR